MNIKELKKKEKLLVGVAPLRGMGIRNGEATTGSGNGTVGHGGGLTKHGLLHIRYTNYTYFIRCINKHKTPQ